MLSIQNSTTTVSKKSAKKKPAAAVVAQVVDTTGVDITNGAGERKAPLTIVDAPAPSARFSDNPSVRRRQEKEVLDAHYQWASRPADEAVYTFEELLARTRKARSTSRELEPQAWSELRVVPGDKSLSLVGPQGGAKLGDWATRQLCSVIEAPSEYMMRLPSHVAAECLTHGLAIQNRRKGPAEMLVQSGAEGTFIRSLTSEKYERVWDADIAELADGLRRNGTWGPCEAFKSASAERVARAWSESKRLPLGWVGDRSSFIALADYEGAVKVNGSLLARFALISNSEVGAQCLKIVFGLMDFACANFILWGCQEVTEISVRHVGDVRERFEALTAPMTKRLESGERDNLTAGLLAAQNTLIADDQAKVFARVAQLTRLPKAHIEDAWTRVEGTPRYGDPRSVWGMMSGLTEASQILHPNADKRTRADEAAAKLMELVG